jgi:hypothetical protein
VTDGVKVWPAQAVFEMPKPEGLTLVFRASVLSGLARVTLPGLAVRLQFVGTPRWKALCELSVKQPLCAAALSVKFLVRVPPSGTTSVVADAVSKPALAAVSVGCVPAGTVNE